MTLCVKSLRRCIFLIVLVKIFIPALVLDTNAESNSSDHKVPEQLRPVKIAYCQYMPFYFEGLNKKPRGILVDAWTLWSKKTGIPVEFILLPWEEALEEVASGRIDINALMYRTPERDKNFDFSQSLLSLSTYLYYRVQDSDGKTIQIKDLDGLNKIQTGVVTKDFTHTFLKQQHPQLVPIEFVDHETLVKAALGGEIQAFLMEGPIASTYIAKHNGLDTLLRSKTPIYTKPLYAGVQQKNPDLINLINKGLALIQPEEIEKIVQNWTGDSKTIIFQPRSKPIKIATSIDNMPFHFADEQGKAVGSLVDLWRLWSKKTGINIEFIAVPWAESLAMVKNGKADIHAGCFFSVQRDTYLDYAGILSNGETHFFFHESIFGLKNLEDLRGFQIGIVDQDYAEEFVNREMPDAALKLYNSHQALLEGVEKGEVRVFICDTPSALYFLEKKEILSSFRYHPANPLYRKAYYSAVKEGNLQLVKQINQGLEKITPQERAAIERKWMGASDVQQKDVLVVAAAQSFPPFSMRNAEGRPSGLFVDMWNRWSKRTGKPVAFRLYERKEAVNALKDGIVDVLSFMTPAGSVRGWTQFSTPFYRFDWYLYQYKKMITNQLDLPATGIIHGAVAGSRPHEWLKKNRSNTRIKIFETTRQMILAAANGSIDGFLALPQEMAVLPNRLGLPESFIQSPYPLISQQMGAAVRNYNPELLKIINKGFESIKHSDLVNMEIRWIKEKNARIFNPRNDEIHFSKDEKKWLSRLQGLGTSIRLGVNPDWAPFEFIGKNRLYKGMVSDYVSLLNRRLGLNMVLEKQLDSPIDASDLDVKYIDVIPSALSFESNLFNLLKTRSYQEFPWVIINKRQASLIGGIRDLHGKSVAVIERYAIKKQLQKDHPEIHLVLVEKAEDGLKAVLSDKVDAFVENLAVAGYQIQAQNITSLKVAASTDFPNSGLAFSVRKDWPELVSILNKGIASISDQEHDQIRQKWFSVRFEHQVATEYIRKLILKIGFAALFLAGMFSFWNWQIRKRKEVAEAANQSKTKFLASLSHEIRTPLNAILGMTEMTMKSPLTVQQNKNLTAVKDSAFHLLDVITDILDFSTIEAGKMNIQNHAFSLNELLDSIQHTWAFLAKEKGLEFEFVIDEKIPSHVRSDPVRLKQILGNLISNAIKFTNEGIVCVSVALLQKGSIEKNDKEPFVSLGFTVKDSGIGIESEHLESIFERFTQAEGSVSRNYGGTGLGLAICREVARLMGGTLAVSSTPGTGSRFFLRLPMGIVPIDQVPLPENHEAPVLLGTHDSGLTFLLVEDDAMNAGVFKAFLAETNHTIIHASDGADALEVLKQNDVDMVFMDIEMPRLDGLSASRSIRNGEAGNNNRSIPIIAMSAHVLDEFKDKSRQAGMNAFIPKPVDMDKLFRIIENFRPEKPELAPDIKPDIKPEKTKNKKSFDTLVDVKKALASAGGNEALLSTIFDIFIQETPEQLSDLKTALNQKNIEDILRYAHTLKGSASRIYAQNCVKKAQSFEETCKSADWGDIENGVSHIIKQYQTLVDTLKKRDHKNNPDV